MGFRASLLYSIFVALFCSRLARATQDHEPGVDRTQDGALVPGHLEPLGSKNVKHSLEVIQSYPDPQTFFKTYVVASKPVLIQNAAKVSPAFQKWTDEYFLSHPSSSEATIQAEQKKKEERTTPDNDILFSEFVKSYKQKDIYMVSSVPEFMRSDVVLPAPLLCRDITETDMLSDAIMWFSSGGTKSVLHQDDGLENINCLFAGTKELLFIDYHKYKHVVPIDFPSGRYSGVDVDRYEILEELCSFHDNPEIITELFDRVDFVKYPGLIEVEYYKVTMQAGDCLYIPHRWFHQVRSFDRNIAVNLWWKYTPGFVPEDCDGVEQNQTLDKVAFTTLDSDLEQSEITVLTHLQYFLGKRDEISFKQFVKKLKKDPSFGNKKEIEWTEEMKSTTRKLFKLMDVDGDSSFSSGDLENIGNADDTTMNALSNEYYRLYDLVEKAIDYIGENDEEDYEEDDNGGAADDYDIEPIKKTADEKTREEL